MILSTTGIKQEQIYSIDKDIDLLMECVKRKDFVNVENFYKKHSVKEDSPLRFLVDAFLQDKRIILMVQEDDENFTLYGGETAVELMDYIEFLKGKSSDYISTQTNQDSTQF